MTANHVPLVVLVGPPAAGKTRLAKLVAANLGVSLVDTDAEVARQFGPLAEIFESKGEMFFREKERDAVVEALKSAGVVSLGGGAIVTSETRQDLIDHRVALIMISADAVAPRLGNRKRPLIRDGVQDWQRLVTARAAFYQEVAGRVFDTSHTPLAAVADDIVTWVREDAGL
jgi:shikimate kinase